MWTHKLPRVRVFTQETKSYHQTLQEPNIPVKFSALTNLFASTSTRSSSFVRIGVDAVMVFLEF